MLLIGQIHSASVQDRDGALSVLAEARRLFPFITKIFAGGGYQGEATATAVALIGRWELEIVKRSDTAKGFVVLPKRWIVERTFGSGGAVASPSTSRTSPTQLSHFSASP